MGGKSGGELVWVLGTKPWSPARTPSALSCCAISPATSHTTWHGLSPGLGWLPKQPISKTEQKLPLGMRPIPHRRTETPLCFKITLVYLYISVLFYFKNAFLLCFGSLGQSCSPGCTNSLFNQNQEKKIHVSISLYISAFFSSKISICWIELEFFFWETCFCTLYVCYYCC